MPPSGEVEVSLTNDHARRTSMPNTCCYHVIKIVGVRGQGTWTARVARQILEWHHDRRDADWLVMCGLPKFCAIIQDM